MARKIVTLFPAIFPAIFLVMLPLSAADGLLAPLLSPFTDDVCKDSMCGKGTCKFNSKVTFPFICECEPGWKHLLVENSQYQFLPCVVPNCTVSFSCNDTTAPAPATSIHRNHSLIDFHVCDWVYCAEGSCVKTNNGHKCICNEGASNLLNSTDLPCYRQCYFGADCDNLGIGFGNSSSTLHTLPPALSDSSSNAGNHGLLGSPGDLLWLIASAYFAVRGPLM